MPRREDDFTEIQLGNRPVTSVEMRRPTLWGAQLATPRVIEGRCTVGAAEKNDIVVSGDPMVSRIHAELEVRADGVWVKDLASTNGTYVNGVRVGLGRVDDCAKLRIGQTELMVRYDAAATKVERWGVDRFGPLVGGSPVMRELYARLSKIAVSNSSVLVLGETGTGKELVARAIHEASPRQHGPYVIVDCAALPESLLESELFGYSRGAFTGATPSGRPGAFESANGGTVFLDEIGELPHNMQPKLLRMLATRTVRRLGESDYREVNVRIISATHRDLREMVNQNAFREDLYFRLAVLPVVVPPLRERREDIPALIEHFLRELLGDQGNTVVLDAKQRKELSERAWRGNVRQLRNVVECVVAMGAQEAISAAVDSAGHPFQSSESEMGDWETFEAVRDRLEREYFGALWARTGNLSAAARAAGVDRQTIRRMLAKHKLS